MAGGKMHDADVANALETDELKVVESTNGSMGVATLVNGTVTVANTRVTANSRIFLSVQTPGGTPGAALRVSARTPGTSFAISTAAGDTSVVAWLIVEPGASDDD